MHKLFCILMFLCPLLANGEEPIYTSSGNIRSGDEIKISVSCKVFHNDGKYDYLYKLDYAGNKDTLLQWEVFDDLVLSWGWPHIFRVEPGESFVLKHTSISPPVYTHRAVSAFTINDDVYVKDMAERRAIVVDTSCFWYLRIRSGLPVYVPAAIEEERKDREKKK